jgi:hypothetical protein
MSFLMPQAPTPTTPPPPPVFASAQQQKPQKRGPAQPTVVGSAPESGQLGSATLLGQAG